MVFQRTTTGSGGFIAAAPPARPIARTPWLLLPLVVAGLVGLRSVHPWAGPLLASPVLEEVVFRLGLHEALLAALPRAQGAWQRIRPAALTAAAFAAAHVALRPSLLSALTLLPALAIGALYQQRRALLPCVALHGLFNALWLLGAGQLA